MGLFGPSKSSGGKPASHTTAANMTRAAKTARRGGSGIRLAQKAAPAQTGKPAKR